VHYNTLYALVLRFSFEPAVLRQAIRSGALGKRSMLDWT
jgi:hypothetical protein